MARTPHPYIKSVTFTPTGKTAAELAAIREPHLDRHAVGDPFAPPTTCPLCYGKDRDCRACRGTNWYSRTGIFRNHSCVRCRDGAAPERCPSKVPGNCGEPHARND